MIAAGAAGSLFIQKIWGMSSLGCSSCGISAVQRQTMQAVRDERVSARSATAISSVHCFMICVVHTLSVDTTTSNVNRKQGQFLELNASVDAHLAAKRVSVSGLILSPYLHQLNIHWSVKDNLMLKGKSPKKS
mmetsp:Transcript_51908/g.85377  ORF Transcript_51908/g.85377 Transcript_51908/m.85377 type:complete len:133 (+) Transcript_51908:60-458(+)|eukprot:CAMPEP_0174369884 /NCGR_PEP_ID=MMETSP0811_2-20130205/94153_1 /TAXON_ID=73025 ORGANISM="Eutreptiella gymnastica-like, Strain CCMP1594" /NCGR_SAMPLE_ID=MMETSP0811_2 /ASSEMBLY_ACC=CAM_ASM_000667 /LENGTH=132 /DNA_ID=CAMNT_0015514781 /DNA_START=60 /DNA_END=458 /DNA_ORIENTATION=-